MIQSYLQNLSIEALNEMQQKALKEIQPEKSIVLIAPTGSGKTLAFLLPLIKLINPEKPGVQTLILTPSRELALQIEDVFKALKTGIKVNVCYGGHSVKTEINNFSEPAPLLIGTPGRISDHIRRQHFDASTISTLVLDEFDKSLELGFSKEMEYICRNTHFVQTKVLTSATVLKRVPGYVSLNDAIFLDFTDHFTSHRLDVAVAKAEGDDKLDLLFRLICSFRSEPALIFCNHRDAVERISNLLKVKGIVHGTYHGGLEQEDRELSLIRFRNGTHQTLLATDLGSRGLDIPEIKHVVHYQIPGSETVWVHRNGRTARMHASGKAWLVLTNSEYVPAYIEPAPEVIEVDSCDKLPELPPWDTLYIGAGKKQKVSKGDIVGFFIQKGNLDVQDIGRIDVLDNTSFAAVKKVRCPELIRALSDLPLKKKKVKIDFAR